ncbi:hypothetical protein [Bacillus toyonensis]|uniref:hypothetical protein n=1 Tax=Bacillus toyonensis TaxID=155322 RepID=UPI000BFCF813|nr:hypothetical protein [Bacillus toyonensis]PHG66542.1 hypothetical protein COI59_13725 [Bacillus toyonensis]
MGGFLWIKKQSIPFEILTERSESNRQRWDSERIIQQLQTLYAKNIDISDSALQKKYTDLYSAIFRTFGKDAHRKAVLAAKLPYKHIRKKGERRNWDEEFIIQSLQVLYKLDVDISSSNLKKNYNNLYEEIRKIFKDRGGHRSAVEMADIDYLLVRKKRGPKLKK